MAIKKLLHMGNPQIYIPSEPVMEFNTPELAELIQDLLDTQQEHNGVGIAAVQIGISKRVMIYGFTEKNPRYPSKALVPITICINPEYEILDATLEHDGEGCLCLPNLYGWVPRVRRLKLTYFDEHGQKHEVIEEGFAARIVQHECDHLEGKIYLMRIDDLRKFGFRDEVTPQVPLWRN